jgi:hypothetical protein
MRWGIGLSCALVACGSSDAPMDAGGEASPEASPADVMTIDVVADVPSDVPADTGIPPLMCMSDADEPNESEVIASPRPQIDDCDGSGKSFAATSSGTGDIDWTRFRGKDVNLCTVDPTVKINVAGLRLCAFAVCTDGVTTVQSCDNGAMDVSPAKSKGCCTTGTAAMTMHMNCSGLNDDADIYIRVDQPTTNTCIPYQVDYHY